MMELMELLERQAEGADAFSEFHLYVCLAFLVTWSEKLREMDFQVRPFSLFFHPAPLLPSSSYGWSLASLDPAARVEHES